MSLIRTGSPGRPPRLSHSSRALIYDGDSLKLGIYIVPPIERTEIKLKISQREKGGLRVALKNIFVAWFSVSVEYCFNNKCLAHCH